MEMWYPRHLRKRRHHSLLHSQALRAPRRAANILLQPLVNEMLSQHTMQCLRADRFAAVRGNELPSFPMSATNQEALTINGAPLKAIRVRLGFRLDLLGALRRRNVLRMPNLRSPPLPLWFRRGLGRQSVLYEPANELLAGSSQQSNFAMWWLWMTGR
jgi:hypothetical protein